MEAEFPRSRIFPPSGMHKGEVEILNLARKSLMKCYRMLQNARVTVFAVSELFRKNQQGD